MLDYNSPLFIAMATVFATAALGLFGWSVQRIIHRMDGIAAQLEVMGNRVTAVETKQARAARSNARKARP